LLPENFRKYPNECSKALLHNCFGNMSLAPFTQTAEHFARTINKLKGKVTMLFITHQIPRGLAVDEVIELGTNTTRQMEVVEEEK
jgi:hypothetical protein